MNSTIGAADDRGNLYKETNQRFWDRTRYKPGQRLDMSDPRDRAMAKTWLQIYDEVRGHRDRATTLARRALVETVAPFVLVIEQRDGSMVHQEFPRRGNLDVQYAWLVDQPEYYQYIAAFDFTKDRAGPLYDHFAASTRPPADVSGYWCAW